jgi:hypothetical protein
VHGTQRHELGSLLDEVNAGEARTDERRYTIERELVDVAGTFGRMKCVNDLANDHELAKPEIAAIGGWLVSVEVG